MTNLIIKSLEVEIERLLDTLGTLDVHTDEYRNVLDAITKLEALLTSEKKSDLDKGRLSLDTVKVENELSINEEKIRVESFKTEQEVDLKKNQLDLDRLKDSNTLLNNREQREFLSHEGSIEKSHNLIRDNKDRIVNGCKIAVELSSVIVPIIFYGVWMNRGLEYEKEGCFTSTTFKGLIGKFKPNK